MNSFSLYRTLLTIGGASLQLLSAWADSLGYDATMRKVSDKVPLAVRPFDLRSVKLLDGPFKRAAELDQRYLLSFEVDRLLHTFRINAGLPSTAERLGGWETPDCELRGHFAGHYLTACSYMYASTGNEQLKAQVDRLVAGLADCQRTFGTGYLSAFPEEFFDRVESGKKVWAPYYTIHKLLQGLIDARVYCTNSTALEMAKGLAAWMDARNARLTDEQMQLMLKMEHGGINEALADLYSLTDETKYLKLSERFNHEAVIGPARRGEDRLVGLHANTQIPKFTGVARQYELTGRKEDQMAAVFFWNTVVQSYTYVIGGNSEGERFTTKEKFSQALSEHTAETCNTYNMLKLTRHLICWEPRAEYADYYERALYNHILASQDAKTGMMCYYSPLRAGAKKYYSTPFGWLSCCVGTGIENHAKYGDSIYFHDGDQALYVNLFIASELNWKEKALRVVQETTFPDQQGSRLVFHCGQPVKLKVHVRRPYWAARTAGVTLNGKPLESAGGPGGYLVVERHWNNGDVLEISLPFDLRTEAFADNPNRLAFMYGPLVLAARMEAGRSYPALGVDRINLATDLEVFPSRNNSFIGSAGVFKIEGQREGERLLLEPYYALDGAQPHRVYWDLVKSAGEQPPVKTPKVP